MKINARLVWTIVLWLILLILLMIFLKLFLDNDIIEENSERYLLHKDGVQVFKNVFNKDEIDELIEKSKKENYQDVKSYLLNNEKLKDIVYKATSKDYVFQDYVWIIKKSLVHTCHRDNNGDFFNENQQYPSYTMLVYLEDMKKCLGILPNSHTDKNAYNINLFQNVVNIPCKKGDVILFNANLIHVGCINKKEDNLRIQLKVSHKNDIDTLQYYQNFHFL